MFADPNLGFRRLRPLWALAMLAAGVAVAAAGFPALRATADEPPTKAAARPANRLSAETSPYLLMHAHNPVDWHPWGEEAFDKAKAENKLVFLSIGYSSCYWCHVMERESFMDEKIAAFLNEHFVCIKVDREERPDVDEIYLTALQVLDRPGGWPLTMFLTPDGSPLFGGTYFPPRDREVDVPDQDPKEEKPKQTGLETILKLVDDAWRDRQDELKKSGADIAAAVRRSLAMRSFSAGEPPASLYQDIVDALDERYDERHGGFSFSETNDRMPKFPEPPNLAFLLDHVRRTPDAKRAREMLLHTLERIAAGGIRDHLGGGFHRYSTDRYWRVPHFEKMLYDNAQLASLYAEAAVLFERDDFRQAVDELLAFVAREMTSPEGAFYAALDAETDGEEGKYYVWTEAELAEALSADEHRLAAAAYGFEDGPNFEGKCVLVLPRPLTESAKNATLPRAEFESQLREIRAKLLALRATRPRPLTDTKILTAWNGLMIRAYADAGRLFERPEYVASGVKAAEFVLAHLRAPDGRLWRTFGGGRARYNAYLDDYAFLADGLIALHRATGDDRWLQEAARVTEKQIELFSDEQGRAFYYTSSDHEVLLARSKDPVDGVMPSGNAAAAGNLAYLGRHLPRPEYLERVKAIGAAFSGLIEQAPAAVPSLATAYRAAQ